MCCCIPSAMGALPNYQFADGSVSGWQAAHDVGPLETAELGLVVRIVGEDPFIVGPPGDFASKQPLWLRLKMKSEAGGFGQLFWFQQQASPSNSLSFFAPTGQWAELLLPLPKLENGWRLRIDPPGTNGRCIIAFAEVEDTTTRGIQLVTATSDAIQIIVAATTNACAIVELAPYQGYQDAEQATPIAILNAGQTNLSLARFDGQRDRLYSGFLAVGRVAGKQRALGSIRFVQKLGNLSGFVEPSPHAVGKKGLQIQMVDDAIALDVKHAALNLNLTALIDLQDRTNSYLREMDGKKYYFNRSYVDQLPIKQLSDAGAVVTLILLAYQSGDIGLDRLMLHPRYDSKAPNRLGAFNTATADGLRYYKACLEFLAERYSRPGGVSGQVANYIVGNEVNSHWHWYNLGRAPMEFVVQEYVQAVRVANTAVRKSSGTARVYISLEHHWNISFERDAYRTCAGRELLEQFARLARLGGDFDWHVAFHPYPENLFKPATWLDKTATGDFDTPRITFKNLELLPRFLRRPELLYEGKARRVSLSEQGFHSDGTTEGERLQAAAYCYAFYKATHLEGIDSFILHRHVDHQAEGGLNLGLWRRKADTVATPASRKPIYEVFRAAETPKWKEAFNFALPIIGITNWAQLLPGVGTKGEFNESLRTELRQMVGSDQEARKAWLQNPTNDTARAELAKVDRRNTERVQEIVRSYGWPGKSLVGESGASDAWLLVQHADHNRAFQKECLELMRSAGDGEVLKKDLAYLTDRVLLAEGHKQRYGTQFMQNQKGEMVPRPLEDESNVDERRKSMGLPPLAEYRKIIEQSYGSNTPAKPVR